MSEVCKFLGIAKSRTTAYHPQCDGLVERHNRTLLAMFSTHTQEHPQSWDIHLQKLSFAYNSSEHASTAFSAPAQPALPQPAASFLSPQQGRHSGGNRHSATVEIVNASISQRATSASSRRANTPTFAQIAIGKWV